MRWYLIRRRDRDSENKGLREGEMGENYVKDEVFGVIQSSFCGHSVVLGSKFSDAGLFS